MTIGGTCAIYLMWNCCILLQHTWHRHWHGHPTMSPHRVGGWSCWIWGITSILMRVSPWWWVVSSRWLLRLCCFGVNRWIVSKHTAKDLKQSCKIRFRLQKKIKFTLILCGQQLNLTHLLPGILPKNVFDFQVFVWLSGAKTYCKAVYRSYALRLSDPDLKWKPAKFGHAQRAKFQAFLGQMG